MTAPKAKTPPADDRTKCVKVGITLPERLADYLEEASQTDYLDRGYGYYRSTSGFIAHLIDAHRSRGLKPAAPAPR